MRILLFISSVAGIAALFFMFNASTRQIPFQTSINPIIETPEGNIIAKMKAEDIESQKPLANPPVEIKAVYATNWSANNEKKLSYLINLIKNTELNAIVIDIKDYTGYLGYNSFLEKPHQYKTVDLRIPQLNKLIKRLHDENIYVIGRISVFQDQQLSLARPDLALQSSSTPGELWRDNKGLSWMDTSSKEVWDYNLDVAEEILNRGFDEVNFDYIRFASDGNLKNIKYPKWSEKTLKTTVLKNFFKYMRQRLPTAILSADLFGLVTVNTDGLGIGQHLEHALPYFDAIAPMVYPSHYFKNFIGFENPAEHPYEVVKYSLDSAFARIKNYESKMKTEKNSATTTENLVSAETSKPQERIAKLRPWLQDFNLGATYDSEKILAQIKAIYDSMGSRADLIGGWMLWNSSNNYTSNALKEEKQ